MKDEDGSKRLERRTLAEGLGLADGAADDRWIAFREQRTSLEYLRSVAEVREHGLHVQLHAYDTRVFWELRELHDSAHIWRRLAERLGGRGVPSLEEALREQQLGPVHDAVRAAILEPARDTVERLVAAVADATGTAGDRGAVEDMALARLAAAEPVAARIGDASQAAALGVWALLSPLGTLPEGAMVGPTNRAWYEELRLAPVVADALRSFDLDEAAAWWAAERIRLLLDLPLPSSLTGAADTIAANLVDAWLFHPVARPFLRVNRWDGEDWFHGESFAELLDWADRLEAIVAPAGASAGPSAGPSAWPGEPRARIEAAVAAAGYRVDRLRAELVPVAPARSRTNGRAGARRGDVRRSKALGGDPRGSGRTGGARAGGGSRPERWARA